MAITFEQVTAGLSVNPFTGEPLVLNKVRSLTVRDYQKWLRKQIRANGRRAELGNACLAPVEAFMKECSGLDCNMIAGGEVEVHVGDTRYELFTQATDLAYWLYDDDGNLITTAGKALDVALLVDPTLLLAD